MKQNNLFWMEFFLFLLQTIFSSKSQHTSEMEKIKVNITVYISVWPFYLCNEFSFSKVPWALKLKLIQFSNIALVYLKQVELET